MQNNVKVGIPRALLYHKYNTLWITFFKELGVEVLISPHTNSEILERGKKLSMDESCLSLKIFIGHVDYLKDKVDYMLVPRIVSLEKKMKLCTNFSALYDIVRNTFNISPLSYNINLDKGITEEDAFLKMGKTLGFGKTLCINAYKQAKKEEYKQRKIDYIIQNKKLSRDKVKILLVTHSYNSHDSYVGDSITKDLVDLGVEIIYADIINPDGDKNLYKNISDRLYWTYNQELLNSIVEYKDRVDGIILLSTFPCGPDSLVNEIVMRKVKIPTICILVDGLSTNEGILTRLESFVDILKKGDIYE